MSDKLILENCPVCEENNPEAFKIYFDGRIKLYQCKTCSLVAQYPGPGGFKAYTNYDDVYSLDFTKKGEFKYPGKKHKFLDIAHRIKKVSVANPSILDVGCGDGHFLSVCKRLGFACTGLEPSKVMADYAAGKVNGDIRCGYYEKDSFSPNSFDVISFIQVVEHLIDPYTLLSAVNYHLKPGGLVVIEIPSVHAPHFLAYKLTGIKNFVKPPNGVIYAHICYHTPRSITYLTKRCGFETVSVTTGRWGAKYASNMKKMLAIPDFFLNAFKVGGILYIGKKPVSQ